MTAWMERVARRLVPSPLTLEEYAAQMPLDLLALVDAAQGRPVRTLDEHYAGYLARQADPAALTEQVRALHRQKRRNVLERKELEVASGG